MIWHVLTFLVNTWHDSFGSFRTKWRSRFGDDQLPMSRPPRPLSFFIATYFKCQRISVNFYRLVTNLISCIPVEFMKLKSKSDRKGIRNSIKNPKLWTRLFWKSICKARSYCVYTLYIHYSAVCLSNFFTKILFHFNEFIQCFWNLIPNT